MCEGWLPVAKGVSAGVVMTGRKCFCSYTFYGKCRMCYVTSTVV